VAAEAQVPLGSTTYHFSSRDDLLAAAIEQAQSDWDVYLGVWEARLEAKPDLAEALSELVVEITGTDRDQAVVEYELYVAALRRPALQTLSRAWDEAVPATIARHTDALTAQALAMAVDGLVVRSLVRGEPLTPEEVLPIFRRIAG
jgi:DNA-binding transcriptional regulator YbjK